MDFKYRTKEELLPYVGKELEYMPYEQHKQDVRKGVLEIDEKKRLWLPFCGGVNAITVLVKIKL